MNNPNTGQFTRNIRQIVAYLLSTYGKISLSNLNYFEKEVTDMHYDPVTTVNNILNKIEDLFKYGNMENFPYSHPQVISKAYNILNKTEFF